MDTEELKVINRVDRRKLAFYSPNSIEALKKFLEEDEKGRWFVSFDYISQDNLDILNELDVHNLYFTACKFKSINGLYSQRNLKELNAGGLDVALNFEAFSNLETLFYYWKPATKHLFDRPLLKDLTLYNYKPKAQDLSELCGLKNLIRLELVFTKIASLNGLEQLPKLKKLEISYASNLLIRIDDTTCVFPNIEELEIRNCKNLTVDFVKLFPSLKKLRISGWGKVQTLKPILDALPNLKHFAIGDGTTIAEVDNRYYTEYKHIEHFYFYESRHHLLKLKDLENFKKGLYELPTEIGVKPKAANGFEVPGIGEIDIDALESRYEGEVTLGKREVSVDITFTEELKCDKATLEIVKKYLNGLSKYNKQSLQAIKDEFQANGVTKTYIEMHLEEEDDIEVKSDDKKIKKSKAEKMLSKFHLIRVGFYPTNEKHFVVADYTIGTEETDELLVVNFDKNLNIHCISAES